MKIDSPKISPIFCPKLVEDQKKGLHSNLVRFLAQTLVQAKIKAIRLRFVSSKLLPNLQRGRRHAAILHTILR